MINQSERDPLPEALPTSETMPNDAANICKSPSARLRNEVRVEESSAAVCYANFCRVTGTPEELILDFGLNAQPMNAATQIDVKQRLIVNYFTAKRLLQALAMSVQRHEHAFGLLEVDVAKRISPAARTASVGG